jgi:hypothetical protein
MAKQNGYHETNPAEIAVAHGQHALDVLPPGQYHFRELVCDGFASLLEAHSYDGVLSYDPDSKVWVDLDL